MRNDKLAVLVKSNVVIELTNRCVIYIRVSSLHSRQLQFQNQLENCQRFAKNNNLEVVKTFRCSK